MLEIFLIIALCSAIGKMLTNKGYTTRWPFQLLFVCLWFGGELFGAVVGMGLSANPATGGPDMVSVYVCALIGAACGAVVAFVIVGILPAQDGQYDFEDHYAGRDRLRPAERAGIDRFGDWSRPTSRFDEPGRYRGYNNRFSD